MSYQVIARKWRPQTFEEVTGQEAVTRTLRNAIEHERLHHAYLFSGARGVGKTTTARLLAKAVNCHRAEGPTPLPCRSGDPEACASCREVAEGRSIDVLEIDAASNTGVDNVRDAIINTIGVRPARDRYKVFIIDEVHMLSGAAFNALLKTLEEPPPRVLFIMATTEQHKVPGTILSRCQQFEFRTIATGKIAERLRLIADAEAVKVSDDALREIARAGEGSMRDAQSAFDQVISFSEGVIETADVEAALGIASAEMLARVTRAISEERPSDAIKVVDELVMRGHDLRNFCRDLLAHVRDLLVVKVSGDSSLASGESQTRSLDEAARDFSESDLVRFFHSLTETEKHLRESAHPRYQLEMGLVKLVEMRRLAPLSQILERLSALEEALRSGVAPAQSPSSQSPPASPASEVPQRGSGAAGGRGSTSLSPRDHEPPSKPPAEPLAARNPSFDPSPAVSAASPANEQEAARPSIPEQEKATKADSRQPNFGAGRAATSANLKLVPPLSNGVSDKTLDAPFPLSNDERATMSTDRQPSPRAFLEEAKQGEDHVGQPISLQSPEEQYEAAREPEQDSGSDGRPGSTVDIIKQHMEGRGKPFLAAAIEGARRVVIDGNEVRVEFAPEGKHLRDMLAKPDSMRLLREVCCEMLGRPVGVSTAVKVPGESDDMPMTREDEERLERQRLRETAENHPLVQKVLQTFRGEIIGVRRLDSSQ